MESLKKVEKNFHKYLDDEIRYIFDRQTEISSKTIDMDLSKLKDKRFEKLFYYYDPKTFYDKYDLNAIEKLQNEKIDPEEDLLLHRPLYIDKAADYCDEKIFRCPRCKKEEMSFSEMRTHIYQCPENYIRNYLYPELTYEPETNGELKTYGQQFVKKKILDKAAYYNVPNNSIFLENHLKAAKEIPAFKLLVTLLESEIKEKTKPILTKEDQKKALEEQALDDISIRKTEVKEDKALIFLIGGDKIWGTDLKNDSLTLKYTFIEQKLFNAGVDGAY